MPTKILVVGGAGYIGSHMVSCLLQAGFVPVVLDNLSTGHRENVVGAELVVGDIADQALLAELFAQHHFTAVMHFAGVIQVGESTVQPAKYYQNNVVGTLQLLQAMLNSKVKYFIFSSSAAVYGEPKYTPIDEAHPLAPINPYGHSKRMVEQILEDFAAAYDFHYVSLRYFNAAGADPDSHLAERHDPETHLIPLVLQAAIGRRDSITLFGNQYPTADGTCVRDYIHVLDLCLAHLLALQRLVEGGEGGVFNLGTGVGVSVQQVIEMARMVSGRDILVTQADPRAGDPAILIANANRARAVLGWLPQYSDLKMIIEHAWEKCT